MVQYRATRGGRLNGQILYTEYDLFVNGTKMAMKVVRPNPGQDAVYIIFTGKNDGKRTYYRSLQALLRAMVEYERTHAIPTGTIPPAEPMQWEDWTNRRLASVPAIR